ncbi:MAG: benzoate/H(+) symporter BenE family transporter [Ancalomicrobiaceae bacterium]|nr:benzoate/H(+) symporter BenE family transporter [Ancalomicrobiaceae bacterium]
MTGLLAAVVGFAGAFPIVLNGLAGVGATPAQAASGLLALCVIKGFLGIFLSWRAKQPISIAWSTPGAALLITAGIPAGGFNAAVGAFIVAGLLIVVSGLWRAFGTLVSSIPISIASAMLAGVLGEICLAPVKAVETLPYYALPIIIVWAIGLRFARLWAVPAAVVVTGIIVAFATKLPPDALAHIAPEPIFVMPVFSFPAIISIALPLFIVTMASQNVPGLTVLRINGYNPDVRPIFVSTGLASTVISLFGGHLINLAAITAALCAQPEAHPDPKRRWLASAGAGGGYIVLGLMAGLAAAFIAAAPPMLIQAVAGLALLGSMAGALAGALVKEEERLPAAVAFVTTASGFTAFGIGSAFWGLVAGGLLLALFRMK